MIPLKFGYAKLELDNFPTIEEKLDAVKAYLEISFLFCGLQKNQIVESKYSGKYSVVEAVVPGGQASYIKTILQEAIVILHHSLDELITGEDDHYSIKSLLEISIEKCLYLSKKNDHQKSFPFNEQEITYLVFMTDGKWKYI